MSHNYYKDFRRWNMDIIHHNDYGYRGLLSTDNTAEIETDYFKTYREFTDTIRFLTGIRLPCRKDLIFCKLSDFEQFAGIDASHCRPQGCIVSAEERRQGWRRYNIA